MQNDRDHTNRTPKRRLTLRALSQVLNESVRNLLPIGSKFKDVQQASHGSPAGMSNSAHADAQFLGWQESKSGEAFALYNVTAAEHPLYQSTVSANTLRKQHLDIPPTPPPERPLIGSTHGK